MKDEKRYLEMLARRDIQPTAIRLLVLDVLMRAKQSLSLTDLDNALDTVDKSTIYRTLTLFLGHHLIHSIDDGTGSFKYAVCQDDCSCAVGDLHTHFHCERCNRTFCFSNLPAPMVKLPEGFTIDSINYVLKGLCPECAAHKNLK
ncbi:transcriptional repressor [Bacteroides sp. ET71]|uniref:Fur family transcriptional regulator n=1 Tax=Bacteroides sp. ET71 TaxID=2939421 RepID=UPI002012B3BB|nr:Fur family transcriptional regulator [Bacteroides sp. ET71]MCL1615852.1 transcriptional repressor [Bacteroides sp. ET71]